MAAWPNWVDLILLILMLRACYIGLVRGYVLEGVLLLGLIVTTAVACNGYAYVSAFAQPWWPFDALWLDATGFAIFWIAGIALSYWLMRHTASLIKHGRPHWILQGVGIVAGAVRGLWICGLFVLLIVSLGNTYLITSVQRRSILSPHLVERARNSLQWTADRFPGHSVRPQQAFLLTHRR